ncbi:hypothetical protein VPHK567_0163 [Vibrio phage K567]|nr:hypothetical protein MYOV011v1_p0047 [Vibrio phage 6E35.1a]
MIDTNIDDLLKTGIVEFEFEKADGSVKTVKGTRDLSCIAEEFHPKPRPVKLDEDGNEIKYEKTEKQKATCGYFDVDAQGWRSFKRANLIKVVSYD